MPKTKSTLPAVTAAAKEAGKVKQFIDQSERDRRKIERYTGLRDGATAALADATARVVTKLAESPSAGSVKLLSTQDGDFVLKHGGNTYQLQDGALAVTTHE